MRNNRSASVKTLKFVHNVDALHTQTHTLSSKAHGLVEVNYSNEFNFSTGGAITFNCSWRYAMMMDMILDDVKCHQR